MTNDNTKPAPQSQPGSANTTPVVTRRIVTGLPADYPGFSEPAFKEFIARTQGKVEYEFSSPR